jgi:hypothetical protein
MGNWGSKKKPPLGSEETVWIRNIPSSNHNPIRAAVMCLNVLAWERKDADHFVSYDVLEDILPYLYGPLRWTFRDSASHVLIPGDQIKDNCYTTDLSVESFIQPQEYAALEFTINMCFHDIALVSSDYDTSKRLMVSVVRNRMEPRITTSGVYTLCVCTVHGRAVLIDTATKRVRKWDSHGEVKQPYHIAVSIYGSTPKCAFVEMPKGFIPPKHNDTDCFMC